MSRAKQITDNGPPLNNLALFMWEASVVIMAVNEAEDLGELLKSNQSPMSLADSAANEVLDAGLTQLTREIPIVSK